MGLHGRILQQFLLLALLEHGKILIFSTFFSVPGLGICCLLPFAVLDPDSSVCMILDREPTLGQFLVSNILYTLHEVGIGFV